jgi:hypothetical protein
MKSRGRSFNIYFALVCVILAGGGCALLTDAKEAVNPKKQQSTIRLYLEGQRADKLTASTVLVTSNKFPYTVQRDPFLTEADLSKASIINDPDGDGGYSIQLVFNEHGTLLMDMYTADNKGKHIIVFSQFPIPGYKAKKDKEKKKTDDTDNEDLIDTPNSKPDVPNGTTNSVSRQSGWLAAVLIRNRISDGTFRFTPDASRKEGFRIVRGLRNVITTDNKGDK